MARALYRGGYQWQWSLSVPERAWAGLENEIDDFTIDGFAGKLIDHPAACYRL
jgi:hypothetical protein